MTLVMTSLPLSLVLHSSVDGEAQGNWGWNSNSGNVVASSPSFSRPADKAFQLFPLYLRADVSYFHCFTQKRDSACNKGNRRRLHNQWSVPAILLFAKNADNENEKGLKIKIFICILYSKLKKVPVFDSCQSSAFRQKYQTKKVVGKKSTFFDFKERGKKLKKLEKFLFPAFLRLVR